MPAPPGKTPILESASAGLRFAVQNLRATLPVAAIGAIIPACATVSALAPAIAQNVGLSLLVQVASLLTQAVVYAVFLRTAFAVAGEPAPGGVGRSVGSLLGAMIAVGFFLFIVCVVLMVVALIVVGPAVAPYAAQIEAAQTDPAAQAALVQDILRSDPAPFAVLAIAFFVIWMTLTSRLYLAAPASVGEGRVRSFETWPWTKGNMLRIIAARLALIIPLAIVVAIVQSLLQTILGVGDFARAFATAYVVHIATFALLWAAEAGLSAYLYRGLRQAPAQASAG